jgi:hypothetical protein
MNSKIMELNKVEVWDGNMAATQAMRQADIDVVAAYPITPSTPVVENYATFHANGYIDGEFVMVESEHAAMSGCVGAAAAGGRLRRMNPDNLAQALAIAGVQAPGLSAAGYSQVMGNSTKEGIPWATLTGLSALWLADKGFTGPVDILDHPN